MSVHRRCPLVANRTPVNIQDREKNADGIEVLEFVLARNAHVFLDLQVPVKLAALERVARRALRKRRGDLMIPKWRGSITTPDNQDVRATEDSRSGVVYAKDLGWLSLAAGIGYAVGTVLDDLAGSNEGGNDNLSDDLSDWAAENFPAPDWLQDIF